MAIEMEMIGDQNCSEGNGEPLLNLDTSTKKKKEDMYLSVVVIDKL